MKEQRHNGRATRPTDYNLFKQWSGQLQGLLTGRDYRNGFKIAASTVDQVDSGQAVSVIGTFGDASVAITVVSSDQIDAQFVLERILCQYFKVDGA